MSAQTMMMVAFKVAHLKTPMDAGVRSILETLVEAEPRRTDPRLESICIRNGVVFGLVADTWYSIRDDRGREISPQALRDAIDDFSRAVRLDGAERHYLEMQVDLAYFNCH